MTVTTRTLHLIGGELDGTTDEVAIQPEPLPRRFSYPIPNRPDYAAEYQIAMSTDGPRLVWVRTVRIADVHA